MMLLPDSLALALKLRARKSVLSRAQSIGRNAPKTVRVESEVCRLHTSRLPSCLGSKLGKLAWPCSACLGSANVILLDLSRLNHCDYEISSSESPTAQQL